MTTRDTNPAGWPFPAADLSGKTAVVTGANSGIGFETARGLAAQGATVLLACRNDNAASAALAAIKTQHPTAQLIAISLDLADLASVEAAASHIRAVTEGIDLLVNNGGVMKATRELTVDGFEADFGTNFLGHFALTGHLCDLIVDTPHSRVVTVSSITHRRGRIHFDDLTLERDFEHQRAYAQSKLANLLFMFELGDRLRRAGGSTLSLASHPGGTRTSVLRDRSPAVRLVYSPALRPLTRLFTQSPQDGAKTTLRAALDPNADSGDFFGPGGRFELVGPPVKVETAGRARDPHVRQKLWETAENLTGACYKPL